MWKVVKQVPRPLILIGAGNLGTALCSNYSEFEGKGLKIVAAFDNDPRKCGTELGHIKVVEHVSSIQRIAQESGAKIAILAISAEKAQEITKMCVEAGISTILNYSPVPLNVPQHVHVEYMDPALKIQMALQSTNRSAASVCSSSHYGLHYSPFPAHILQPVTPLLVPFRKYAHNKVMVRSFSTYNNPIPPSLLHSNRYASDFEELGMLGQGGFGSVYQARNRIDRVDYAVKKVRISTHSSALHTITEHKYLREVRAMARLNHPNLVRYYYAWIEFDQHVANDESCFNDSSFGSESVSACGDALELTSESYSSSKTDSDTTPNGPASHHSEHVKVILYIQMELCTGVTLKEWMGRADRAVNTKECHSILAQLVQGLHHIHAHGFIHRDVTPPNIFMEIHTDHVVVRIGDFGLAKPCGDHHNTKKDPEVLHVDRGDKTVGVGTFLYASPEQLSNAVYDTKADMYSVGVILFELLHPFKTQMERVCFLTQLKEGHIPPYIAIQYPCETGMIETLLNKDPSQRPSAEQISARVKHMTQ